MLQIQTSYALIENDGSSLEQSHGNLETILYFWSRLCWSTTNERE